MPSHTRFTISVTPSPELSSYFAPALPSRAISPAGSFLQSALTPTVLPSLIGQFIKMSHMGQARDGMLGKIP